MTSDRAYFQGNNPRYVTLDGTPMVEVGIVECDGMIARYVDMPEGRLWWTGDQFVSDHERAEWKRVS